MTARFYTISDSAFFAGTVVLHNSLRLTGHEQEFVVLDCGLTERQRKALTGVGVTLIPAPAKPVSAYLQKPYPAILDLEGVVVLIDSDMAVTDSLAPILARAAEGDLCVFPDHPTDLRRWFPEWERIFRLGAPLRQETYMNAGFVAAAAEPWGWLLKRWRELCLRLDALSEKLRGSEVIAQHDQDLFNALIMSEVPMGSVHMLPAYELDLRKIVVEDPEALLCTADGKRQPILHLALSPKVWQPGGWKRVGMNTAYVQLAPRLLFRPDVPLRLDPEEVPVWLRPGRKARVVARAVSPVARFRTVPSRARRIPNRVARELRRGLAGLRSTDGASSG